MQTGNMISLEEALRRIGPLDEQAMADARARQDILTKPQGALGRLEELSVRIAGITGNAMPALANKAVVTMAADHGVALEGVRSTCWPGTWARGSQSWTWAWHQTWTRTPTWYR